jgi:hypothetical protein
VVKKVRPNFRFTIKTIYFCGFAFAPNESIQYLII